jgi:hypothetical protein
MEQAISMALKQNDDDDNNNNNKDKEPMTCLNRTGIN